jgi:hypothetical protein
MRRFFFVELKTKRTLLSLQNLYRIDSVLKKLLNKFPLVYKSLETQYIFGRD